MEGSRSEFFGGIESLVQIRNCGDSAMNEVNHETMDMQFLQLVISLQGAAMHQMGKIVNPMTGEIKKIFSGQAVMIYAADIQGDYREEAITLDETGTVKVFWNENDNANPVKPRYWQQQHYRRQKQNWNYYSP